VIGYDNGGGRKYAEALERRFGADLGIVPPGFQIESDPPELRALRGRLGYATLLTRAADAANVGRVLLIAPVGIVGVIVMLKNQGPAAVGISLEQPVAAGVSLGSPLDSRIGGRNSSLTTVTDVQTLSAGFGFDQLASGERVTLAAPIVVTSLFPFGARGLAINQAVNLSVYWYERSLESEERAQV